MFWTLVDGDEQYSQFLYILLRCMKSNTVEMVWFVQHYSVKGKVIGELIGKMARLELDPDQLIQ